MNTFPMSVPRPRRDRWWAPYVRTALLLSPSIVFFAFAVIFVFPKVKQMCADTNYDARYFFQPVDALTENIWLVLAGAVVVVAACERWLPFWRRYRAALLTFGVFVVHSAVLLGLFTSLVVMAIVGPAMAHRL